MQRGSTSLPSFAASFRIPSLYIPLATVFHSSSTISPFPLPFWIWSILLLRSFSSNFPQPIPSMTQPFFRYSSLFLLFSSIGEVAISFSLFKVLRLFFLPRKPRNAKTPLLVRSLRIRRWYRHTTPSGDPATPIAPRTDVGWRKQTSFFLGILLRGMYRLIPNWEKDFFMVITNPGG